MNPQYAATEHHNYPFPDAAGVSRQKGSHNGARDDGLHSRRAYKQRTISQFGSSKVEVEGAPLTVALTTL